MDSSNSPVEIIRTRIEQAAARAGKTSSDINLVAVSKRKPQEDIVNAYNSGIRIFGENRAEELAEKAEALSHLSDLKWHFIGNLQSRQSKIVAQYADCFHAVDRIKIAKQLSKHLVDFNRNLPIFIQVNVSGEESKSGFSCDNWQEDPQQLEVLTAAIKEIAALPHLTVLGLMTMAPFNSTEAVLRPIFQKMSTLSEALDQNIPELTNSQLSMGMSGDFEIAIEEGATHVRIGSAIFGARTG